MSNCGMNKLLTQDDIAKFKELFSKFCRGEEAEGRCAEDSCDVCPVNAAYSEIFDSLELYAQLAEEDTSAEVMPTPVKFWKNSKNRYELHLDNSGHDKGVLYYENTPPSNGYWFRAYISGASVDTAITAVTLEEAKRESEKWLGAKLKQYIEAKENEVKAYQGYVKSLAQ